MSYPAELIDVEQARRLVLEGIERLPSEAVELGAALGRALAERVTSADAVPGFDSSAMDGFAVRAHDTTGARRGAPVELRIADESRAGRPARAALSDGQAVAISTGAMVPAGADAVVRVEDTTVRDGRVEVEAAVEPGGFVRPRGDDLAPGDTVLERGAPLGAAELGVLASVGCASVRCTRRPRVALVTTGDELRQPGAELAPGEVRNSIAYAVPALATLAGAETIAVETVGDDAEASVAAVGRALEADVAVVCGGISVGEHDHVRQAMLRSGVEQVFWGVALRPGKPTWFGRSRSEQRTLAFGLPGNPVSSLVTFLLFVRPVLRALAGAAPDAARASAILDTPYDKRPGRAHAIRCSLRLADDGLHATPAKAQGSHVLTSMLGADVLAIAPAESGPLDAGAAVEIELLPGALDRLGTE